LPNVVFLSVEASPVFQFLWEFGSNCRDMGFPTQRPIKVNSEVAVGWDVVNGISVEEKAEAGLRSHGKSGRLAAVNGYVPLGSSSIALEANCKDECDEYKSMALSSA